MSNPKIEKEALTIRESMQILEVPRTLDPLLEIVGAVVRLAGLVAVLSRQVESLEAACDLHGVSYWASSAHDTARERGGRA